MTDFSETGLLAVLFNFVIIFMGFLAGVDAYHYFKEKKRFISFVIFFTLFMLSLSTALVTSLIAADTYSIILSIIFLISLFIGLRFRKIVTTLWIAFFLLLISAFIAFISYLISGENGKIIAKVRINKLKHLQKNGRKIPEYHGVLYFKGTQKKFSVKGEMIGVEGFQMVLKPYMQILFGKKRLILTSVMGEVFNEDSTAGFTDYKAVGDGIIDKKSLWLQLERKKLLLAGVRSVQRIVVTVFPKVGQLYIVRVSHQGLTFEPTKEP